MFKPAIFISFTALFLSCTTTWAESSMNKCTDGKQLTYTDKPCKKLGLKEAGPIKDTVTIVPATAKRGDMPEERNKAQKGKGAADEGGDSSKAATIKPVSPLVDKILNW